MVEWLDLIIGLLTAKGLIYRLAFEVKIKRQGIDRVRTEIGQSVLETLSDAESWCGVFLVFLRPTDEDPGN